MNNLEIIHEAKRILTAESEAISNFKYKIDDNFINSVISISKCTGKVFVSGVGKSGIIARKISATFSSLGSPSINIDPLGALHGDLGMIDKNDMIILISNSGETNELIEMLSVLKRNKNLIISITNNRESTLAKASTFNINSHCDIEANEEGLIPTCSTTTTLAIGDALGLTVAKYKKFKFSDFARVHPSGKIGKNLYRKVEEVMIKDNLPLCDEDTKIEKIIILIEKCSLGSAFILSNNKLKGIITDGDIRRQYKKSIKKETIAKDIMNTKPKYVFYNDQAYAAIDIMMSNKINILPVLKYDKVVGAIQMYNIKN
tara:strand:- start:509 stop:1456 length:948 start_codon:yes stop_codon:yes gene_type:complete